MVFLEAAFDAFVRLLIIMAPFTGLPVFLRITQDFDKRKRIASANRAIYAALGLFVFFLFLGNSILEFFGISFEGFRIAGGIILLLLGIEYMFHLSFKEQRSSKYSTDIIVPFAMPLIIGPGVIMTTILFTRDVGYVPTLIGGLLALGVYWLFLRYAHQIAARIGAQGIEVLARFMGLLLMAMAIDMMKGGIVGFMRLGLG